MNEEQTSSATSFSSFLKSKDFWTTEWILMICAWNTMNTFYLPSFLHFHTCYFILVNLFLFPIKELFNFSNYGINIILFITQYVGAGINTLISISDGLGPSIFCRKTERTRPMREAMDGKVVYFPPESAFRLWYFNNISTFPYFYLDLACKQLCFPPRRR